MIKLLKDIPMSSFRLRPDRHDHEHKSYHRGCKGTSMTSSLE